MLMKAVSGFFDYSTLYSKKEVTQLSKKTLNLLVEKLNASFND